MRRLRPLAVLLVAASLTGCFQSRLLIRLQPDGSGTVEETVRLSLSLVMASLVASGDDGAEPSADSGLPISEAALAERAATLGEGVRLVRVEPLDVLFGAGYRATYAFDDVRSLHLTPDVTSALPGNMGSELREASDDEAATPVTFDYRPGELTIHLPRPDAAAPDTSADDEIDPDQMRQMRLVMKDVRMSLAVELPGPITATNAAYASGSDVTLFDVDMGALLGSPDAARTLRRLRQFDEPPSLGSARILPEAPGLRVEPAETVTVAFE